MSLLYLSDDFPVIVLWLLLFLGSDEGHLCAGGYFICFLVFSASGEAVIRGPKKLTVRPSLTQTSEYIGHFWNMFSLSAEKSECILFWCSYFQNQYFERQVLIALRICIWKCELKNLASIKDITDKDQPCLFASWSLWWQFLIAYQFKVSSKFKNDHLKTVA